MVGPAFHTNFHAGKRVTVVGGGQAGGEAVLNLLGQAPGNRPAAVTWISRRANYAPLDDSPFTNDYFMPCYSDYFFAQRSEVRHDFVRENVLASDGISEHTLRDIYQAIYRLKFVGGPQQEISLRPGRTVTALAKGPGGWTLTSKHHDSGARESLDTDVIIWATGMTLDWLSPVEIIGRDGVRLSQVSLTIKNVGAELLPNLVINRLCARKLLQSLSQFLSP